MGFFEMKWRLVACRMQNGYSQKEVAQLLGVTEKTIISWELGKTAPNIAMGQKISEVYGIPLAYIDFTKEGNRLALKDRTQSKGITL